jgi:prophage regulatory protein
MMVSLKIYLDLPEVAAATTLGITTIQRMVRENQFPAPRQIGGRRVGWLVSEVTDWAMSRPVSDLPPPPNTGAKKPRRSSQFSQAAQKGA